MFYINDLFKLSVFGFNHCWPPFTFIHLHMLQSVDTQGRVYYSLVAGASLSHSLDPDLLEAMGDKVLSYQASGYVEDICTGIQDR